MPIGGSFDMGQNKKPLSFVIVGSGWRSLFFARIAQKFPQQFELKYMLCRTKEKAEKMSSEYGIPTTLSPEESLRGHVSLRQ